MSTTERTISPEQRREFARRDIAETKAMEPLPMTGLDVAFIVEAWFWRAVLIGAAMLPLWMVIRVAMAIVEGRFP